VATKTSWVFLAKPLAAMQGWCTRRMFLMRVRETRSQVGLSPMERKAEFIWCVLRQPAKVYGKAILLMDDVVLPALLLGSLFPKLL